MRGRVHDEPLLGLLDQLHGDLSAATPLGQLIHILVHLQKTNQPKGPLLDKKLKQNDKIKQIRDSYCPLVSKIIIKYLNCN